MKGKGKKYFVSLSCDLETRVMIYFLKVYDKWNVTEMFNRRSRIIRVM